MKKGKTALCLILTGIITVTLSHQLTAQNQKENRVKVKVISNDGKKVVDMDTMFSHDVFVYQVNGETTVVNLDSIMEANRDEIDKHMKVLAFKMDSIDDFHFDMDADMEKMEMEIERVLKEKGIVMEEMEHMKGAHHNRVMVLKGGEHDFDIQEFMDEDGEVVKIIKKEVECGEDGKHGVKTYVITSDAGPMHWKERAEHRTTVKVESIPMDDIAFLKKIGVSPKKLMAEPLELEKLKVKIEKIMEDETLQTLMHIECELPEGTYQMEVFNQEGQKVKEKTEIKSGPFNEELELKKEEAPYYLLLSKNNQLFGRKIVL